MGILSFLFGCGSESSYYKKGGKWHYDGVPVNREQEPVNFKPIDDYFAKDDQVGYYRGIPIHDGNTASDGPSFQALSKYYAKDKLMVYYCDTERDSREYWSIKRNRIVKIKGADPASFRMMGDGYTARDARHMFRGAQIVPVRDLDSYEILDYGFGRDKVIGYYRNAEIAGSDGASFAMLDSHYARDRLHIYYVDGFVIGGTVKGVSPGSFRVLEDGYATDGTTAWYRGAAITSIDAGSLQYLSMGVSYAKTSREVFHRGRLVRGADAASFAPNESFDADFDATDRSGRFSQGERVK